MDDQYLDAFIRESEEEITKLNNSLLELESDPNAQEAMDQIFRTAHTLKGNFGAMGFDDASNLAHAMEDLLDEMREGNMSVTSEVMDLIFAGVDQIEAIVKEIEEEGEASLDTSETVSQLRAVLEEGTSSVDTEENSTTGTDNNSQEVDLSAVDVDKEEVSSQVVHAVVDLGDSDMPGVDSMFILESVEEAFDIIDAIPDREDIENGDFEDAFTLLLDADDTGAVADELEALGRVHDAAVDNVTDEVLEEENSVSLTGSTDEHEVDEIKSVRVDVDKLDDLHGLVEQLVTSRIKLRRAVEENNLDSASDTLNELDKITANLQNTVMDMRLIPLKKVVGKFPRMVRDLSRELDKEVNFEIEGEDIELDRTILTEISDPLMHIIRNALDHGIESPEQRVEAGKPTEGQVTLRASRQRDHVTIEVADDGAGLDVEEIKQTAIERNVRSPEELEMMDNSDIYDLVFHPGFSTAEEVTDTSGRGVGMDVVHDTVTQLDGSVDVDSTPGEGSTVSLRLPVTMAIVKVLFVQVGDEEYGVPIKNVDEITSADEMKHVNGQEVIKHNEEIYPVINLGKRFEVPRRATADGGVEGGEMLVRIRESERQVALRCDAVNSQEEVVVKPLEGILSGTPGLSGTAVLGDGNIVHILDVVTL
ncbi:chemotaxis protein CheA [Halovenus rubra]|uniref:Chemotaxis protein CheA n=2 Tax=Halovenus rubra TaxID=869890 RepID=A0ABD5XBN7_9EURY|nr:chemotaxis protein CheA [Halovenus rubra]